MPFMVSVWTPLIHVPVPGARVIPNAWDKLLNACGPVKVATWLYPKGYGSAGLDENAADLINLMELPAGIVLVPLVNPQVMAMVVELVRVTTIADIHAAGVAMAMISIGTPT